MTLTEIITFYEVKHNINVELYSINFKFSFESIITLLKKTCKSLLK